MNAVSTETKPPRRYSIETSEDYSDSLIQTCEALLKSPGSLFAELDQDTGRFKSLVIRLSLIILGSLSMYSLVVGAFTGGSQTLFAMIKIIGGMLSLGLMTFPSLYVALCLSGERIPFRSVTLQMLSTLALSSLLLVGMTPILWIFSQSTESHQFFGILIFLAWIVSMGFGVIHLIKSSKMLGIKKFFFPGIWLLLFCAIALQMTTSLRPFIGTSETFLPTDKKTFIEHWGESIRTRIE